MLTALGAPIERIGDRTIVVSRGAPTAFDVELPADPSSAVFLAVAATITAGSEVTLVDVLLNPGRVAFVDALRAMGGDIDVAERGEQLGEPRGDLVVRSASLHGAVVECQEPSIDEIPALAVAATFAEGTTEFRGAGELRVKESDRVATTSELVRAIGGTADVDGDTLVVHGGTARPANVTSHGDHRIALAAAVAANATTGTSTIEGWSASAVSYPGFLADLEQLTDPTHRT
jgi:3-phosphoshikimate 1-carboxyvinyltransferase